MGSASIIHLEICPGANFTPGAHLEIIGGLLQMTCIRDGPGQIEGWDGSWGMGMLASVTLEMSRKVRLDIRLKWNNAKQLWRLSERGALSG